MKFDDDFNKNTDSTPDDNQNPDTDTNFPDIENSESEDLISLNDYYGSDTKADKTKNSDNPKKKKKILVISLCSAAAAVIAAIIIVIAITVFKGGFSDIDDLLTQNPDGTSQLTVEALTLDGVSSDFIIATGVQVNGVDIGEKTLLQAKRMLSGVEQSLIPDFTYQVKAGDKIKAMKSSDLEYSCNTENVLATAVKYTNLLGDSAYNKDNPTVIMELTAQIDNSEIDKYINNTAKSLTQEPVNAEIKAFHPWEEEKFEYSPSTDGYSVDAKQLSKEFYKLYNANAASGVINAAAAVKKAKVTVDFLKENIVALSSAWTYSTNTANGNSNMKLALERSNGAVIEPGEVYSFSAHAGNTNLTSEGYLTATVISDGQAVQETGGGVCQAATTIYDAAIYANLEIVEREGHFWCSTYVKAGFDATISYGNIDLKLRNTTEYPVFLETKMEGTKLICNMYGYQDPSYDEIATYSYNYDYYSSKQYSTRAYRVYLKDGSEVAREYLDSSVYSLTENHYVVASDSGTVGAKPGGSTRSVSIAKDPNDGPLVDLNTDDETEPPTEKPTKPTPKPTEAPTAETEPTEAPTSVTDPTEPPTEPQTDPTEDSSENEETAAPSDDSEQ